jgi:hypothetical protein
MLPDGLSFPGDITFPLLFNQLEKQFGFGVAATQHSEAASMFIFGAEKTSLVVET